MSWLIIMFQLVRFKAIRKVTLALTQHDGNADLNADDQVISYFVQDFAGTQA